MMTPVLANRATHRARDCPANYITLGDGKRHTVGGFLYIGKQKAHVNASALYMAGDQLCQDDAAGLRQPMVLVITTFTCSHHESAAISRIHSSLL